VFVTRPADDPPGTSEGNLAVTGCTRRFGGVQRSTERGVWRTVVGLGMGAQNVVFKTAARSLAHRKENGYKADIDRKPSA